MQFLRSFFKRITDDLKQKKLIPLKLLFFVHASTLFVLYPYLTIHMRELGINVEETAIMSAVTPVVSIVMPPLAGMLADKIGNFRLLLAISSALGGVSALLLLTVPVGRIIITFPTEAELIVSCDGSALHLQQVRDYPCQPLHPYAYDINLTVLSCGFVCELPQGATLQEIDTIVHANSYDVHLKSQSDSQRLVYRNTISTSLKHSDKPMRDHSTSRVLTNDPFFNSTSSKVGAGNIFFPVPQLYEIDCSYTGTNATCIFDKKDFINDSIDENKVKTFRVRITHDAQKDSSEIRNYWVNAVSLNNASQSSEDYDGIEITSCKDSFAQDLGESIWVKTGSQRMTKCAAACAASATRKTLCANRQQEIELDPSFTFWTYLAVRVFIGIISGTAFAMFEGAVIAILREQRADYGLQRLYGSIGGMISSPLSGLLIDYASRGKGYTDFRPAFYLYAVLKVVSGVLMLSINLEFKQPAQNIIEDVISVFRNVELVALFIACFIMGASLKYVSNKSIKYMISDYP
ncbi:unnamed protein product [Euphydryas editha]|uniref:Major facilitator superfamily associated domain-containing protein n=1 Tax=Euphydryas editha TaxID=104508 RepID=A0AAU9UT90_EUPED|nr:unnamed protein product [Euphydryas editha]